mmetsp:Transcript_12826/g.37261  ORF Transcript_12826/g.37261 Transcript_12826/m.37261 type:complete len:563 (-) Transcript_12826:246-1934(-)|eukprot:CAMPEP_0119564056 /NCGR_PEP_ID=MMETSP1352-20130426/25606_1 /TAXON_ID=265584 /ORGANISM="Stauroneis constricta, Strain CCMP1120" /LENGTH=562 /DNA_ID=CAMNT_0007612761 /DNA_START=171 /DNA_END=1859 /DNA_ORIENTATION=+
MSYCRHGFEIESEDSISRRCDLLDEFIQFIQRDNEIVQKQVGLKDGRPFVGDNHVQRWKLHCTTLAEFVLLNESSTELFDDNMAKLCWSLATNCLMKNQLSSAYCIAELGILVQAKTNCPINFGHLLIEHYHPPGTLSEVIPGAVVDDASYDIVRNFQKPLQNLGRNVEIFIAGKIPCSCLENYASSSISQTQPTVNVNKISMGLSSSKKVTTAAGAASSPSRKSSNRQQREQNDNNNSQHRPIIDRSQRSVVVSTNARKLVDQDDGASKPGLPSSNATNDTQNQQRSNDEKTSSPEQKASSPQTENAGTNHMNKPNQTAATATTTTTAYKYKPRSREIKRRAVAAKRATMLGTAAAVVSSPPTRSKKFILASSSPKRHDATKSMPNASNGTVAAQMPVVNAVNRNGDSNNGNTAAGNENETNTNSKEAALKLPQQQPQTKDATNYEEEEVVPIQSPPQRQSSTATSPSSISSISMHTRTSSISSSTSSPPQSPQQQQRRSSNQKSSVKIMNGNHGNNNTTPSRRSSNGGNNTTTTRREMMKRRGSKSTRIAFDGSVHQLQD